MRKRPHQPPSHLISLGYHFSWSGTTPGAAFAGMAQLCEGNISNRKRSNSPFSLCPCIRNLLQTTHLLRKTKVQSRLPVSVKLPHFPLCASSSIPSLCRMEVGDFPSSPCSSHFRCCCSSPEHLGVTFLTVTSPPCKQSCLGIQPRPLWNSPVPLFEAQTAPSLWQEFSSSLCHLEALEWSLSPNWMQPPQLHRSSQHWSCCTDISCSPSSVSTHKLIKVHVTLGRCKMLSEH